MKLIKPTDSDASAKIQSALNAGQDVTLAPGVHNLAAPVRIPSGRTVIGQNRAATIVRSQVQGPALIAENANGITLADFSLFGPSNDVKVAVDRDEPLTASKPVGIDLLRCHYATVRNVEVGYFGLGGARIEHCYYGSLSQLTIKRCGVGLHLWAANCTRLELIHLQYNAIGGTNLHGNIIAEGNYYAGVVLGAAPHRVKETPTGKTYTFRDAYFEQNGLARKANPHGLGDIIAIADAAITIDSAYWAGAYTPNPTSGDFREAACHRVAGKVRQIQLVGDHTIFLVDGVYPFLSSTWGKNTRVIDPAGWLTDDPRKIARIAAHPYQYQGPQTQPK